MSIYELWRKQKLECKREKEKSKPFRENFKKLKAEKGVILAKEKALQKQEAELIEVVKTLKREEDRLEQLERQKNKITEDLYGGAIGNPKELSSLKEQEKSLDNQINILLELYLELEEKKVLIEKSISVGIKSMQEEKKEYNQKAHLFKQEWEESRKKLEELNLKIKTTEVNISSSLLDKYHKLEQSIGNNPLAEVRDGFCLGCGIQLSSLLYQQLRLGEYLQCENCGRLLLILD